MDYKKVYLAAFEKTFDEIDSHIISKVKTYRKRDKNFTAIVNQIEKDLKERENEIRTSLNHNFPNFYALYKNRFNEYGSDHLTSYFKYDFQDSAEKCTESRLQECAAELGALESYSRASVNFSNSDKFLEAIYALNKNYEHYTLTFEPNENPVDSNLFHEMQKERFPGYGQEPNLVEAALEEIKSDPAEELVSKFTEVLHNFSPQKENNKPGNKEDSIENEIRAINPQVKLFLLRQLYYLPQPIQNYFSIPELMKLIKILELSFDTTIFDKKPSDTSAYRPVNKGLDYYTQIKTREKIKSDAIKYLNLYGLTRFKEYITFHAK